MLRSHSRKTATQSDAARQTVLFFRWLVWGVILVMLAVMIYHAAPTEEAVGPGEAVLPVPLPEAERPTLPVDREKLAAVEDNTQSRNEEKDAWFGLLDLLRSTPEETLRRASRGPVTWIQLFNQPEVYRGEPVTLVGRVRRAHRLGTPENKLGFEKYYRLWLQPRDDRDRLIVVYCLKLPEGFPLGMSIDEPVVLTGLFFKRWLYRGQADFELAPVVLANSLQWTPRPKGTGVGTPMDVTRVAAVIVVALVLSIVFVLFWHFRTRRPKQHDLPEEIEISETRFEVRSLDEEAVGEDTVEGPDDTEENVGEKE